MHSETDGDEGEEGPVGHAGGHLQTMLAVEDDVRETLLLDHLGGDGKVIIADLDGDHDQRASDKVDQSVNRP